MRLFKPLMILDGINIPTQCLSGSNAKRRQQGKERTKKNVINISRVELCTENQNSIVEIPKPDDLTDLFREKFFLLALSRM